MALRTVLYQALSQNAGLIEWSGMSAEAWAAQVLPRQSQMTAPTTKPYLVYGLMTNVNEGLSEDPIVEVGRQNFQVWIEDEGGDFTRIDAGLALVKSALVGLSSPADALMTVRWLETSQEFDSLEYGTIYRYLRFEAVIGKVNNS
jgi:hypothetical protein